MPPQFMKSDLNTKKKFQKVPATKAQVLLPVSGPPPSHWNVALTSPHIGPEASLKLTHTDGRNIHSAQRTVLYFDLCVSLFAFDDNS